jgi:hypothetical protein
MKALYKSLSRGTVIATVAVLVALGGSAVVAEAGSAPAVAFTALTLQNGWTGGPFSTNKPAVASISGIIHSKGAMMTSAGTNPQAFTLPVGLRPTKQVFVAVDMCNGTAGRLDILPSGVTTVQSETSFSQAKCFTSLDGVSFAP